jgi:hypothetical protein
MHDLTCKEYIELINSLNLPSRNRQVLFQKIRYGGGVINASFGDQLVFNSNTYATSYFVNDVFTNLGKDFYHLLKYSKWKKEFIDAIPNFFSNTSGSKKNEYFTKIYEVIKKSEELNLKSLENRNFFLKIFHIAVNIEAKIEEDSIVKIMYDMFKDKENIDLDLFKEIFALYIEKIKTDAKYQKRINDIKAWAATQDFTELTKKYKNIRNYFDDSNEEKVFTASSKKYDLKAIAKQNKTKLSVIQQNFNELNNFISEKLKTNENIQDFIIRDEKIFYKVLIVYDKRDFVINAAIKMHESFFAMIKGSESLEKELMYSLWDKLMMKADLESSFAEANKGTGQIEAPRKITKL